MRASVPRAGLVGISRQLLEAGGSVDEGDNALRPILIGLAIAVVLAAGWLLQLLWAAGQFKTLEPHFAGSCREIGGVIGAEDITIHPRTGVAYLSAFDRRALRERRSSTPRARRRR